MEMLVIHIVGAASCRRLCLSDLKKSIGGAHVFFNYQSLFHADKTKTAESFFTHWIKDNTRDQTIVLTTGLPYVQAKYWFKKTYPERKLRHIIWEIHHNELSEDLIIKERSKRLLFGGILEHAKKALQMGFRPADRFLKHTPLKEAMEFEMGNYESVDVFLTRLEKKQTLPNKIRLKTSIVCEEAFDPLSRKKCISKIQDLIGDIAMPA